MELRQALFWDADPSKIDLQKNARYVIERVLEFGEPLETGWIFKTYSKEQILKVINSPRTQVGKRSKALWILLLK